MTNEERNAMLNPTQKESDEAMLFVVDYMKNKKHIYKLAKQLQDNIGMGGLWRGYFTVQAEIIRTLNDAIITKE